MLGIFTLSFLLNGHDDLDLKVRQDEFDKLFELLNSCTVPTDGVQFVFVDTAEGRSVAVNLIFVQAVRFLVDSAPHAELAAAMGLSLGEAGDEDEESGDCEVQICLGDRVQVLEEIVDAPVQLADLFQNLTYSSDVVPFHRLDAEGEPLMLNTQAIVWVSASTFRIEEGWRIIDEEAGDMG